jgi:hypothetical protein
LKGILPDDDYSKEAKAIYAAIMEHAALFETEKVLDAKNIAALRRLLFISDRLMSSSPNVLFEGSIIVPDTVILVPSA